MICLDRGPSPLLTRPLSFGGCLLLAWLWATQLTTEQTKKHVTMTRIFSKSHDDRFSSCQEMQREREKSLGSVH